MSETAFPPPRSVSSVSSGQPDAGLLHRETGRYVLDLADGADRAPVVSGGGKLDLVAGETHQGEPQRGGRPGIEEGKRGEHRVELGSVCFSESDPDVAVPPPQIDLFANRLNHQLPLFFSPCPD